MSMTFDSLAGFASHLAKAGILMMAEQHHALEKACVLVENAAKANIGTYQGQAGPFAAWQPLAASTLSGHAGHPGKAADTPLLETGELRDSIEHRVVSHDEAHVGSNNPKAVWQELGTSKGIPPRSFLGSAAFQNAQKVADILGHGAVESLLTGTGVSIPIQ